jgi:hypothetical protein
MIVEVRLDRLLGREVLAGNNRRIGRIEEFRSEVGNGSCRITAFVIGAAGLSERLGMHVKSLFGVRGSGFVARWNQIDLSDPDHPRLTCPVDELERV